MAAFEKTSNTRHILVADDDENDFFLLQLAFRKAGLEVTLIRVRDGQEAIDYLSAKPSQNRIQATPRLFLLDLKMPGVVGFDVLNWLQARPEMICLTVIVLSSSSLLEDHKRAKDLGAKDYFSKPVELDEFVILVKALHDRWLNDD